MKQECLKKQTPDIFKRDEHFSQQRSKAAESQGNKLTNKAFSSVDNHDNLHEEVARPMNNVLTSAPMQSFQHHCILYQIAKLLPSVVKQFLVIQYLRPLPL